MTDLLEKAFKEAEKLPPEEQDRLASAILAELESDHRWDSAFATSQKALGKLAERARQEYADGETRPLSSEES